MCSSSSFLRCQPGTEVLHCLLSWLEQNDGAVAESEAGGVTPSLASWGGIRWLGIGLEVAS